MRYNVSVTRAGKVTNYLGVTALQMLVLVWRHRGAGFIGITN